MTRKLSLLLSVLAAAAALAIFPTPAAALCGECELEDALGFCNLECNGCGNCTLCPNNPGCAPTDCDGICNGADCTACPEDCTVEECADDCNDGWCDPMLDCFCGDGQGDCTIEGCNTDEECLNGMDDDGDGYTDCDDDFCTGTAQCCYGDETTRGQCMNGQNQCVEDLTVSGGCCSNGTDNDGDGDIDLDDSGCNEYTCADPCADNNGAAGTDCDVDDMSAPCCTYGGHGTEAEGGTACCSDGLDNDGDGLVDSAEVLDCGGGACTAAGTYSSSATCGDLAKALVGAASADIGLNADGSCGAANFLASGVAASTPNLCSVGVGSVTIESGSAGVDYFGYTYAVTAVCSGGKRMLPDGSCTSCPIGTNPLPDGSCSCADGDNDGDGICDAQDPCDSIADGDLTSVSVAAGRGLNSPGDGSCACASYVRDLNQGDQGPDVVTLQDFLVGLGHLGAGNFTPGAFDSSTLVGLHYYQMAAGLSESHFDAPTRSQANSDTGGPLSNSGVYDATDNACETVVVDLCNNFNEIQDQAWVDAAGLESVADPVNGGFKCVCPGKDAVDCPNTPTDYCLAEGECCNPDNFWSCDQTTPPECIANEECCGGCCGLTGAALTCCENPNAAGCTPPSCEGLSGQALTCCQTPNDSICRSCNTGYSYCPTLRSCVSNSSDCPVEGCYPTTGVTDPFSQVASYCTVIASETDADSSGYGDFYKPWRIGYEYSSLAALDAFFGSACNNGTPLGCTAGDLVRILTEQNAARTDALNDRTAVYPVYGVINRDAYGATCSAMPCEHEEECSLYVGGNGKTMASCVPVGVCDPCDETLPECPGNSAGNTNSQGQGNATGGGNGSGACCRSQELCECDPEDPSAPIGCCSDMDDPNCRIPVRGVAIEAVPNIIDAGANGRCLVVWASQGVVSVVVSGNDLDPDLVNNFAGSDEVGPTSSSVYKIVGTGPNGETYEATDLCATTPVIREL